MFQMKQIHLIRHAKVDIDSSQKIGSSMLQEWVERYDKAPIKRDIKPPKATVELVRSADVVLTSSLRRTHDTAKLFGVERFEQNEIFDEIPVPNVAIPFLKLRPSTWLALLRVLLVFGFGKNDSSLDTSKKRAEQATKHLLSLTKNNNLVLIGHGGMNYLIGEELLKNGWERDSKLSHQNLGVTSYYK